MFFFSRKNCIMIKIDIILATPNGTLKEILQNWCKFYFKDLDKQEGYKRKENFKIEDQSKFKFTFYQWYLEFRDKKFVYGTTHSMDNIFGLQIYF